MAVTAVIGTGASITFSGVTYPILSFDGPNISLEEVNASKMSTTAWHDILPCSLKDPGEVTVTVEYTGTLPTLGTSQAITLTYSNTTSRTGTAFCKAFNPSVPLEDKMTAQMVLRMTGAIS